MRDEIVKRIIPLKRSIGRRIRMMQRKPDPGSYGRDFIHDILVRVPHVRIEMIFDVGAYIGDTPLEFADWFPGAEVHAFEPVEATFVRMQSTLIGKPEIRMHKMAMGSSIGTAHIYLDTEHPMTARLVSHHSSAGVQLVQIGTIDAFCQDNNIDEIDILKIDVEGRELEVLDGATRMLWDEKIGLLKIECTVDPDNDYHTQLFDLCSRLHPLNYRIFGIYDQYEYSFNPKPNLRRMDAAFVSRPVYESRRP